MVDAIRGEVLDLDAVSDFKIPPMIFETGGGVRL
jgi:hypothetical protein